MAAWVCFLVLGYFLSDYYLTDNFALDWYSPKAKEIYGFTSFTFIRIAENFILIMCSYVHRYLRLSRNYPEELNISQEINSVLLVNYLLSVYFEVINNENLNSMFSSSTHSLKNTCFLGLFNMLSVGEMFRTCAFIVSLFMLTYKSSVVFPLPFMWVFKDLSKFIFEPICLKIFMDYLEAKDKLSSLW